MSSWCHGPRGVDPWPGAGVLLRDPVRHIRSFPSRCRRLVERPARPVQGTSRYPRTTDLGRDRRCGAGSDGPVGH